jgi:acyl-protein synthetase LuxE
MAPSATHADRSLKLDRLVDAHARLLVATRLWARRRVLDEAVLRSTLDEALLLLHRHYVTSIPVYRQLALQAGLQDVDDARVLTRELLVTSELFKSYDAAWLAEPNFHAMTGWIATIFTREPAPVLDGAVDLESWRAALRADGVFLTLSSGTTGMPSFVPRDALTLTALRRNGDLYGAQHGQNAMAQPFDCLALTAREATTGLQAAGLALAARAARAHHLDAQVGAAPAWDAALAFLGEAAARERPVLVFGPPPRVNELCARAGERRMRRLAPGSMVATGGGWKGAHAVAPAQLTARIEDALGVPAGRVVDTYGAAELNCVLVRCPHERYHVPPLLRAVVLDDLLVPVEAADAQGRLGFLDPFALSYPGFVIPGDVGQLVEGRCRCGLGGTAIAGTIERAHDEPARGCATAQGAWSERGSGR